MSPKTTPRAPIIRATLAGVRAPVVWLVTVRIEPRELALRTRPPDRHDQQRDAERGDDRPDDGPQRTAGHRAAFQVSESLQGPDGAECGQQQPESDGDDLSHGRRLVHQLVAQGYESLAERAGASGERALGGGVLGLAGGRFDLDGRIAERSQIIR